MKIIFMGTPDFAIPTLQKLINSHHKISAVFTQKPKAKGRGLNEINSPVHELALKYKIAVHTPSTLKSNESLELIDSIDADIIVVIAYGFIVPPQILMAKKYGCLNIHPSSLPRHRGAAPLQRTIIEGDKTSSVCIMQMDAGLDTGGILLKQNFDVPERVTFKELHDKCAEIGADLLLETLEKIDDLLPIPQGSESVTYAHKLTKEEGEINWQASAHEIDCKVRGMNPWPGVYFTYQNKIIKVLEADYLEQNHNFLPGTVTNNKLEVACSNGILRIKKLQQEGKKPLKIEEFLRGTSIPSGTVLNNYTKKT